jgi:hypothetical protein
VDWLPRSTEFGHLRWLQANVGRLLTDAVVITTGHYAYLRLSSIAVVPAPLLGSRKPSETPKSVRTIMGANGIHHLLTFKDAAVDAAIGSKPEFETTVDEREPIKKIIACLGYTPMIELTKHCENFRFTVADRELIESGATLGRSK